MSNLRLIARLDVKGPNLIKGIQLEGLRVVGNPQAFATRYYQQGVDEIVYMDAVASLYDRETLGRIVSETAQNVFIPITVGGGLRSLEDVHAMLRAGADKVALNSAATQKPELIGDIARTFGSQCMVLQIDAKRKPGGGWEAFRDCGREHTGLDVIEWARRGAELGAGEILLTSIDCEGMRRGFDTELVKAVSAAVSIPVIASGGYGEFDHLTKVVSAGADAVALAYALHYDRVTIPDIRSQALAAGLPVRSIAR
ncbi:imidazole glycerol phosphate synthase subunit HisF [Magnetospirillum gryphiswaldense]|uniref:Imidazole glycerol phosphate synthase subunit HisF n=1 Tax=Magnetospirillum gryphiswaldense TaxID=55518 RepID=A4U3N7_9PROT|nr:imidazole glycerol phosphate synthase cyclase subunit [Magnetospirillum gryphiswaldense]AVM74863.1 Imidazole glycerol phosphate synthase subunit HisF [Magnetospirillum gryphiswaldense MSR-1]AVM78766.1 Imidazole glycerol phosphate synthase subunit HisF [Magnetospirillum gryphiswaldense]CAM77494.1 imidazole glycerol phosphate synthase, cyclase subunit HisF [Magnetospirillum gryphiswaldense MSR-1]